MKDFIAQNYLVLIEIVMVCVSLVAVILKKTKLISVDTPFEKLLEKLPELIKRAEILSKDGKVKRNYVLSVSYSYLSDLTGKPVEVISGIYCDRILAAIESILETPEKKGVIENDKKKEN